MKCYLLPITWLCRMSLLLCLAASSVFAGDKLIGPVALVDDIFTPTTPRGTLFDPIHFYLSVANAGCGADQIFIYDVGGAARCSYYSTVMETFQQERDALLLPEVCSYNQSQREFERPVDDQYGGDIIYVADLGAAASTIINCVEQSDLDNDSVPDDFDNCPNASNSDQQNTDGDGQGNACDNDDDNDGVNDFADAFPFDPTETLDTDLDGIGNNADWDDDNDGVLDVVDSEPLNNTNSTEIDLPLDSNFKGGKQSSVVAQ